MKKEKSASQKKKDIKRAKKWRLNNLEKVAAYAREWRLNNPDKAKEHAKKSREKNRDKILERQRNWCEENKDHHLKKSKEWYYNNKDRVKYSQILRQFGVTKEQYDSMFLAQNGTCALCGGGPDAKNKSLAVDHCHKTGRVRSLLCRGCNVGIGNLKDDPKLLDKAAEYVRKYE